MLERQKRSLRAALIFFALAALVGATWAWGACEPSVHRQHAATYLDGADEFFEDAETYFPNFVASSQIPAGDDGHGQRNLDKFPKILSQTRGRLAQVERLLETAEVNTMGKQAVPFGGGRFVSVQSLIAGWHPGDFPSDLTDKKNQLDYAVRIFIGFDLVDLPLSDWCIANRIKTAEECSEFTFKTNLGILSGSVDYAGFYVKLADRHVQDAIDEEAGCE